MSAKVMRLNALSTAELTGSHRPRTEQQASTSQRPALPSVQAVNATGPSIAAITSAIATLDNGRANR